MCITQLRKVIKSKVSKEIQNNFNKLMTLIKREKKAIFTDV